MNSLPNLSAFALPRVAPHDFISMIARGLGHAKLIRVRRFAGFSFSRRVPPLIKKSGGVKFTHSHIICLVSTNLHYNKVWFYVLVY